MEQLIAGIPFPLQADGPAPETWQYAEGVITADAPARSDLFIDPAGRHPMSDAPRLIGTPEGDFQLTARVSVDFNSAFDAGVLIVYIDEKHWAKLCFEYTPQKNPSVVTVVTRVESDDANAFELGENTVWLRLSRDGGTFAFHASTDRTWWRLVRYFALTGSPSDLPVRVGFEAQAPTGEGCRVRFDEIEFRPGALVDMRDGS
jgi:regulation of enolase protein 1 (concanavalin A-like superfamily)